MTPFVRNLSITLLVFICLNIGYQAEAQGIARIKAKSAAEKGDWVRAVELWDDIIAKNGTITDFERRYWALKQAGQYERAIQDLYYLCSNAIDLPHKHNYYLNIISIEELRSNDTGIERALNAYVKDVGGSKTYIKRAEFFESKRRFEDAIEDYKKVPALLAKEGKSSTGYKYMYLQKVYNLKLEEGLAEETLQDIQYAEMDYAIDKSLSGGTNQKTLDQWNMYFRVDKGNANLHLGNYEEALAELNSSMEINHYAIEWSYYFLGELEMFRGNYPAAISQFAKIRSDGSLYPLRQSQIMMAYCLSSLNRQDRALQTLSDLEKKYKPTSGTGESHICDINSMKAWVLYKMGRKTESLALINNTVLKIPHHPDYLLMQARIFAMEGDNDKAYISLSKSLENNMRHIGKLEMAFEDLKPVLYSDRSINLLKQYHISSPMLSGRTKTQTGQVKITVQNYSGNEKRLALVIGNGTYQHGGILANPENDARDISSVLQHLGFDVMTYENQSQDNMKRAIDEFGRRLKDYDVGLFFYAGHGLQAKGTNYLVPVNALIEDETDVEFTCVDAGRILTRMEDADNRINIIVLDACRDNPFERSWTRNSKGRGLARMDAPTGSIIAYATEPGNTASDGSGRNGLYTSALLEEMQKPDVIIEKVFRQVRTKVIEWSDKKQTPWESTSLTGDFFFNK